MKSKGSKSLSPTEARERIIKSVKKKNVYCAITGSVISARRCLAAQGQNECFGCAAPSHLCHHCKIYPIAFPEVDCCDNCLLSALKKEKRQKPASSKPSPRSKVDCLVVKRKITISTCRATQSLNCRYCNVPSRLCIACQKRQVFYLEYGLCLNCTVQEFGIEWLKIHAPKMVQRSAKISAFLSSANKPNLMESRRFRQWRRRVVFFGGWDEQAQDWQVQREKPEFLEAKLNVLTIVSSGHGGKLRIPAGVNSASILRKVQFLEVLAGLMEEKAFGRRVNFAQFLRAVAQDILWLLKERGRKSPDDGWDILERVYGWF